MQEGREPRGETKGRERVVGKAAGNECVFIPGAGPGWQMRSDAMPLPDAAGGEGVPGSLNRKGVVHRYAVTGGYY